MIKLGETEKGAEIAREEALHQKQSYQDAMDNAQDTTQKAVEAEHDAEKQRDEAIKAETTAEENQRVAERQAAGATEKEAEEARLLLQSQETAKAEAETIQDRETKIRELTRRVDEMSDTLQKTETERDEALKYKGKYDMTDEAPVLRARLTEELLAKLSDPEVKIQIQQMISEKNGEYTKSEDPKEVAEAFMDTHFESIHVALSPILSGLNRELFLEDYAKYYKAMQFIEPSLIAQRVYRVDPSEGYLDHTFKVIQEYYEMHKGQIDYLTDYLEMLPVIVLHSQNIEEYPLQKTGQAITAKTLQLMTPILAKNLDVTAQLVQSMQTHDRLLDARFIGEPYILKKAAEAHSEISEPYKEIMKMEATKEKSYKEGLVTGVDEGHCQTMNDNLIQALRHNKPIPITSKDMMFLTQCQTQKKLPRDTDNLP